MTTIINWLWKCVDILITGILGMMVVLVFSNVLLRYGFDSGIRASVELSRLGLVWIVLLGAAVVLRRGEHLAVTEFSERFFPSAVPILNRLIWLVILISSGMLLVGAINQTLANWHNISPLTGLPVALFALAGVISAVLIGLIALARIFNPSWQLEQEEQE